VEKMPGNIDTAKETFDAGIARAKYLLRLHRGLIDTRQRKTRRDWASGFKMFMRWPQSSNVHRIDGRDALIVLRDGCELTPADFKSEAMGDLLRAALVMAVSAMDAYFHAKIVRWVVTHSRNPSSHLLKQKITVEDFLSALQRTKKLTALQSAIKRTLSYQSLQDPDKIAEALRLIGVSDFWDRIAKDGEDKTELRTRLKQIVGRRHQIAHEGDLSQSKKARNRSRPICQKEVVDAVDFISEVVTRAEIIINETIRSATRSSGAAR